LPSPSFGKEVHNAADELYTIFNLDPRTKGPAGWLLDPAIHNIMRAGRTFELFKLEVSPNQVIKFQHWFSKNTERVFLHIDVDTFSIQASHTLEEATTTSFPRHVFSSETKVPQSAFNAKPASFRRLSLLQKSKHALLIQATVSSKHGVNEAGILQLKDLGVKTMSYLLITSPNTSVDLTFPVGIEGIQLPYGT